MLFIKLLSELAKNGKLLVGYLLTQLPLTDYPGLKTAIEEYLADASTKNLIALAVQVFLVVGASHRALKIVLGVLR